MTPVAAEAALPLYTMLPFALMLLAIAVFPLWLPHWWEHNLNKLLVAARWACPSWYSISGGPGALADHGRGVRRRSSSCWRASS